MVVRIEQIIQFIVQAAPKSYCPHRSDISNFLKIFNTWWTFSNLKQMYAPNILGHGVVSNDKKLHFLCALANLIEEWSHSSCSN